MTIQTSDFISNAQTVESVVDHVNAGRVQGFDFSSDLMAGQYAAEAYLDDALEYGVSDDGIFHHLECLASFGARSLICMRR